MRHRNRQKKRTLYTDKHNFNPKGRNTPPTQTGKMRASHGTNWVARLSLYSYRQKERPTIQNQGWGPGVFNTMVLMIYAFLSCLMETFKKEKRAKLHVQSVGRVRRTRMDLSIPPLFLYWNMTPFLASYLLPFPQPDSELPHTRGTAEQGQ